MGEKGMARLALLNPNHHELNSTNYITTIILCVPDVDRDVPGCDA